MQITFNTDTATPAELSALARFVQDLAALGTAPDTVTGDRPAPTEAKLKETAARVQMAEDEARLAVLKQSAQNPGPPVALFVPPAAPVVVEAPEPYRGPQPGIRDYQLKAAAELAAQGAVVTPIAPADRPDVGSAPVDDQQAAAVFGQQRIDAAPPSVAGIPTVPAAPSAAASPASATVPPVTAAAPSAGVELDSKGLPWDARIHAANRSRNQDGSWRQRRGLNDEALRKRVEDELRAALALPAPPAPSAAAGARPWETAQTEQYLAGTPTPPAPPAVVVPPAPATFGEFMAAASNLVAQGKLAADTVTVKLQGMGLATVMALASRPDLIPDAWAALHT